MAPPVLDALYNHICLPPRLPGVQDANLAAVESALLERLHSAAVQLLSQVSEPLHSSYAALQTSLQACRSVHINRRLDRRMLAEELLKLQPDCILILHITEQNAGLLIWRQARYVHSLRRASAHRTCLSCNFSRLYFTTKSRTTGSISMNF